MNHWQEIINSDSNKIELTDDEYKNYRLIMNDPNNTKPAWWVLRYMILGELKEWEYSLWIDTQLAK